MRDPAFYGSALPVEHRETQISHVFLVGDRAYKLKKELVLPFVDYGTLERRRFFCHEEIRLNRPLAPRVYVGVRAIAAAATGFALADERDPNAVEYVVEMRRFSEEDTLASHVAGARCEPRLMRRVGAHLAGFHAGAPPPPRASADTLVARVREDVRQLTDAAAECGDPALGIATADAASVHELGPRPSSTTGAAAASFARGTATCGSNTSSSGTRFSSSTASSSIPACAHATSRTTSPSP